MEQLKKKTTPTSFYLADGTYDSDGYFEIDIALTSEETTNPFVYGPIYNISRRSTDTNEDINGIVIFVKKAQDNGDNLEGQVKIFKKVFNLREVITANGRDSFDLNKDNSLIAIHHTNVFDYNDVVSFCNKLKHHYNYDIGSVIQPIGPRKAGMSLILKRPAI